MGPVVGKLSDGERDRLIPWEEKVVINKSANQLCLTEPTTHLAIEKGLFWLTDVQVSLVRLSCCLGQKACVSSMKPTLWWRHRDRGDGPADNLKFPFRARVSWLPAVMLDVMGS